MQQLDWLLSPVTFYSLASVCLIVSLVLFVNIKMDMAKAQKMADESVTVRATDQLLVRGLESEIETLRESMRQLEMAPSARAGAIGINLNKRAQALRMHRRGEAIPSIAAALETPCNEVALLLKIHSLTN